MMSNLAKESAMNRINALLDENSFVDYTISGNNSIRCSDFILHIKIGASGCYQTADFDKAVFVKQCIDSIHC